MAAPIEKYADTLYSLDIIERIEELQAIPSDELTTDEQKELTALLALQDEAELSPDWIHGETLINEHYFCTYTQDLADECYSIPDHWPFTCIDWLQAAEDLKQDYRDVEYMGSTFWILA